MTVLFVPHANDAAGVSRTRRLFVDLKKRAVPVATNDIIILDEVNLAAILSRRLVDEHAWFSRGQIDVEQFNNTIAGNASALCSIGTLYDVIRRILSKALAQTSEERAELKDAASVRLPEPRIDYYYRRTVAYFEGLARANARLGEYLEGGAASGIAQLARSSEERNVLVRPVGQQVYANAIAAIASAGGMDAALDLARQLPFDLAAPPYADVIWDTRRQTMRGKGLGLATRLLKHMFGFGEEDSERLRQEYGLSVGRPRARLPDSIVRAQS